jgi:Methyltransferase FkbM domain
VHTGRLFNGIAFALAIQAISGWSEGYENTDLGFSVEEQIVVSSKEEMFREFLSEHIPLDPITGKIAIPENVKHVKLDIGLSYSAPMSQHWLSHEENLMVFGFEPNPAAVTSIKNGAVRVSPLHGEPLDVKYLNRSFFVVPCALGLSEQNTARFYITREDCGCSSLYEPVFFDVADVIAVPLFSLSDFFDLFPFDKHPLIEYIKIDAQGSDLNIVKSAGHYLSDRVIYITIEAENWRYRNTTNSEADIDMYMESVGFVRYHSGNVEDPTYLNVRYIDYAQENEIKIFQNG